MENKASNEVLSSPTSGAEPSLMSPPLVPSVTPSERRRRRWLRLLHTLRPRTREPTSQAGSVPAAVAAILDSSSIERITLMLGSSLMWTMLAVMARRSNKLEHTVRLLFYVSVGAFVGVLSCSLRMIRPRTTLGVNASVVARGLTTAVAFTARFMSLHQLRIVDSAALTSMAPVLTWLPAIAPSATRRPGWMFFSLACMMTAVGLLLYQQEVDQQLRTERLVGFLWAFLSACLVAGQQLFSAATTDVPQGVLLLHSSFIAVVSSALLAARVLDSPRLLLTQVDMGEMSVASQMAFAYVFFVSKARETDQGLANMYKYAMDVLMACALSWTFLAAEPVPLSSYGAAALVLCAVVSAEVQRLSATPRPARSRMRFFM
ncbi:uncharacterized protein LOC144119335 [Amblyomma americanum]